MADIRTEEVLKLYGNVAAVDHVNLEIREGSFTAILGPSGCGKTTLLRCIAGLIDPDAGKIYIGGADVTRLPPFKRNLGFVFQRPAMFPHMTVYENVAWALQLRNWPKAKLKDRVMEMLKLVRLETMSERTARQLSGGQAQRVVIARALAPQPDVLLLDEPLSQLDAKLRDELKLEISMIHRATGCTTVMVTHDQAEALTIADNVLLMHDGRIVQQGTPVDIYRHPTNLFSAGFIGTNNILEGTIVDLTPRPLVKLQEVDLTLSVERVPAGATVGMPVWVCVRADDIDVIDGDRRSAYSNVIETKINEALLTGGIVLIQTTLGPYKMRIHVGGNRRFDLLNQVGTPIVYTLGTINLIPRSEATAEDLERIVTEAQVSSGSN
jgi:ABC-type Fe3+/spermidine/putrescine transport system ATPase subunit